MVEHARRPPSITDVARLAGVSHQTVSRVLNNHPYVRPDTRARVHEAIASLQYRPNVAARALATGNSKTIGVVTLDTTLFGPISTLYGIERAARTAGYYVSVIGLRTQGPASLTEAIARLEVQGVAGIVLIVPVPREFRRFDGAPGAVPIVVVEGSPNEEVTTVAVDQRSGARSATEHLLNLGHSTVHHISGPPGWAETRGRAAGWRSALQSARCRIPEPIRGDWSARSGYDSAKTLLNDGATAVFVANDTTALGLLRALHEMDRRIPGDVSVVGFDDSPESEYFAPPLTTVRQDFDEVGQRCIDLLLIQISARRCIPTHAVIQPELVTRASTGSAPRVCN